MKKYVSCMLAVSTAVSIALAHAAPVNDRDLNESSNSKDVQKSSASKKKSAHKKPSPKPSPTKTVKPSPSPSPTKTVKPSPSPSPTKTVTPSPSPSPTKTVKPSPSPSPSPSPTKTVSPSPSPVTGSGVSLISYVASGKKDSTSAINATGANFIAICSAGYYVIPPTDSAGNSYVQALNTEFDGYTNATLWVAFSPKISASQTFNGNGNPISVAAYKGVASGPDQTAGAIGESSGNVKPTSPNELALSCLALQGTVTSNVSVTVSGGMTQLDLGNDGSEHFASLAYEIQGPATSVGATWSYSPSAGGDNGSATNVSTFFSAAPSGSSGPGTPSALVATTTSLPAASVGAAYSVQLGASGGVAPFTWKLSSGTLPAGLKLSSTGLISGTPSASASSAQLQFLVTDSSGKQASTGVLALTLHVASAKLSASLSSNCVLTGTQGQAYGGCAIVVTGGTAPYTYSWSKSQPYGALPEGLTLNASTGQITGTVWGQGGYIPEFIIKDSSGAQATLTPTFEFAGNNAVGTALFPADSAFHIKVTSLPVDTSVAAAIIPDYLDESIKPMFGNAPNEGFPNGIPFITVPANQPLVPVTTYAYQSYFTSGPWPSYAPIEGSQNSSSISDYIGDGHSLIVQLDTNGNPAKLWEMFTAQYLGNGAWGDGSNAVWNNIQSTGTGAYAMLPQGGGSTDAAGLPVAPLLVTADEVIGSGTPSAPNGSVHHPIRFTLNNTLNYHVWPATAQAGLGSCSGGYEDDNNLLSQQNPPTNTDDCSGGPLGEIYRLKASVKNPACASASPQAAIIIQGMRDYGIILADNGASGGLIGTPDSRWNDDDIACLNSLILSNFEPVNVQGLAVSWPNSTQIKQ